MALGSALLRILQTVLRALQLCCAVVACGIFAFFLAILANDDLPIPTYVRAVAGMAGAAIIYTAFAVILTLCLAGVSFLGFVAVVLDICFIGCFIAIAYYNRGGASTCTQDVDTPVGSGMTDEDTGSITLGRACVLSSSVFSVSIVAILLFILTAILQVLLVRQHKRNKRYGPSPSNDYTSGAGRRPFWKRGFGKKHSNRDAEMATNGHNNNPGYMNSTNNGVGAEPKYGYGNSTTTGTTTTTPNNVATNY